MKTVVGIPCHRIRRQRRLAADPIRRHLRQILGNLTRKFGVDVEGPRQGGRGAVEFLIDEVAHAAHRLRQEHVGRDEVQVQEQVELVVPGVAGDAENAADQTAVDAQAAEAAMPKVDDVDGVFAVVGPAQPVGRRTEHVVETCADDAEDQGEGQHVPDMVRVLTGLGRIAGGDPRRQHRTAHDEDAVPVQ